MSCEAEPWRRCGDSKAGAQRQEEKAGWERNVCRSAADEPLLTVIATLAWLPIRWGLWGINTAVAKVVLTSADGICFETARDVYCACLRACVRACCLNAVSTLTLLGKHTNTLRKVFRFSKGLHLHGLGVPHFVFRVGCLYVWNRNNYSANLASGNGDSLIGHRLNLKRPFYWKQRSNLRSRAGVVANLPSELSRI